MLRRVVKDHSDIKNPAMMLTADSVWKLKECGNIRALHAPSAIIHRIGGFYRTTGNSLLALTPRVESLQIAGIILSFLLSEID
ncbi:hypothetical protein LGN17_24820 [Burkholderia sp. AU30280]|uniref:hypothetical protein n=1 Tax=Burkholderia sp. AU30280 TaxID=2879628 RepID=UPI001CF4F3DF|nr:hypothetical protein [Burkholderia sp. AU30280]MCA8275706.1 hypothetical protein [Burkholderia sp. AU30280]